MSKLPLWKNIANVLTEEKSAQIPTEQNYQPAKLSQRLAQTGTQSGKLSLFYVVVTWSKRGSGVFVSDKPTNYKLGDRTRFSQRQRRWANPIKKNLYYTVVFAQKKKQPTKIKTGSKVLHYVDIICRPHTNGLFSSVFCLGKFPNIEDAIKEHSSVTTALSKCGVTDYKRHSTAVKAVLADAVQSNHLRIKPGDPLLRTESVWGLSPNGNPIEFKWLIFLDLSLL